ncbi:MAG: hypothetical protein ACJARG_000033 [Arcticibacterium sp.]|jgi:hypothetical protein
MIIPIKEMTSRPEAVKYRGVEYLLLKGYGKDSSLTIKQIETKRLLKVITVPHKNITIARQKMFVRQVFYYIET